MGDKLNHFFHLSERGTNIKTEILAGTTTFLTCVYIVAVNPGILSAAGMDTKAVFWATAVASAIACIWIGLWANLPFALAPAMGLNAYFTYYVCNTLGLPWQNALACVAISGITFMLLSIFKVQQKIVDAMPDCIKHSVGSGIGFFIAFTGLMQAGIVTSSPDTLLTLGDLANPGALLALFGIFLTAILVIKKFRGAILIGILVVTALGILVKDPMTGIAYTVIPDHIISFDNPVTAMAPTFGKLTLKGLFSGTPEMVLGVIFAIISFLFVDLFDSIGVLLGVSSKAGLVDEKGNIPCAGKALFVSAGGAAVGALLGTNTVTIYGAESATGINEGGRTGLTACVTGVLFLFTLFLSPLFLMIPSIATAPALVMVGIFMIEPLRKLPLDDVSIALPVFLTVAFMPFTYNIAYGILFGLIGYTIGQVAAGKAKEMTKTVWVLTVIFIVYLLLEIIL
ncbi:putative MFS transporter, AGZA family, xanthine/uracil permease [Lacrimispora sphenoides]|jgi:AGZA family xanthine/uracil permease-like MFS transporter|uniref:NCS2 family permease n=1 Tax=Lacrimispora sphenoides TaxID=29370 RepID=UPI0008CCD5FC|nr:NCS2 family permease [Lacrimispora sphenoides]SET82113.1 putative MFS transporter, AGZA family, xanthine/uracil permease [Lacrimispora sphenoides]